MLRIFCLGFPKCGTSSFHFSFLNAGLSSIHEYQIDDVFGRKRKIGVIEYFQQAEKADKPLLYYCNNINAFTQMDWSGNDAPTPGFPQMIYFKKLYEQYPDSRFILNTRCFSNWIKSLRAYSSGDLIKNWTKANLPNLPRGVGSSDEDLGKWWEWHHGRIREFFNGKNNFLEINIEDSLESNQTKLHCFLQLDNFNWQHCNQTR